MADRFDYIITGAGCAGSSLLMRMLQERFFDDKKILVIDQSPKTENDRTWCFWETGIGLFEPIVSHRWQRAHFLSPSFSTTLELSPYSYKMIRGIDLYQYVKSVSASHPNVEWLHERVTEIQPGNDFAAVRTESGVFHAGFVFNSILFEQPFIPRGKYFLWQHFMGWIIETPGDCFDASTATFMDFNISQQKGTAFMYVLPVAGNKALVEYALFSASPLQKEEYEQELGNYINDNLKIGDYHITHTEFGMIPMTNISFPQTQGNIINIGIAGGQVKGSSGYAFQFIQKRAAQLVNEVMQYGRPYSRAGFAGRKFRFYDSVLLHVLQRDKMKGADIFTAIFRNNSAEQVLCFLDNETGLGSDLRIMRSMPVRIFLPAALTELIKAL